jgi:hypothetical protein
VVKNMKNTSPKGSVITGLITIFNGLVQGRMHGKAFIFNGKINGFPLRFSLKPNHCSKWGYE